MKLSILSVVVCVALLGAVQARSPVRAASLVKVVAYEMSRCPYCSKWKQNFQSQVMEATGLPEILDLKEYFVGSVSGDDFTCLHGPEECVGNRILLCAKNLSTTAAPLSWWNLGVCMQTTYEDIPTDAQSCATKVGVNWDAINTCASGALGETLFKQSIAISNAAGVHSTPTVFVNGKEYVGGPNDPLTLICNEYQGTKPAGCKK